MIYYPDRMTRDGGDYIITSSNAIILAQNGLLCLQRRTADAPSWPSALSFWGGMPEDDETFDQAMQRELHEELEICGGSCRRAHDVRIGADPASRPRRTAAGAQRLLDG